MNLEEVLASSLAHGDAKVRKTAAKEWTSAPAALQACAKQHLKAGIGKKYEADVHAMLQALAKDVAAKALAFDVAQFAGHLSRLCERGQSYATTHDPVFARAYFETCLDAERNALNLYDHDLDFDTLPDALVTALPALRAILPFEELFFHGVPLTSLPAGLAQLADSLKRLDLSYSALTTLPDVVFELRELEQLELYVKTLVEIPEGIGALTKLRELKIGNAKLKGGLPAALWTLPLEQLHLFEVGGVKLEGIGALSKLKVLDVRSPTLKTLPAEVGQLTELEELTLFGCKKLASLPDEVFALPKLKKLDISWTPLSLEAVRAKLRPGIELDCLGVS